MNYLSAKANIIIPYTPGEQPADDEYIKLNTNENPYPPSPHVINAIKKSTDRLRLYPDPESSELKKVYAEYTGLESENIFVGNGSDEVLSIAFQTFFMGKKDVLIPDISYSFYPVYCSLYGVAYNEIKLKSDFTIDCGQFKEPNNGIVIANPNAPTSIVLTLEEIEQIVKRNTRGVILIDEAYIDFGGESAVSLIKEYPNLIVVSTLSKSRSLAGLRVGFAAGNNLLIEGMNNMKNSINSYPVDVLAQNGARAAILDTKYFEQTRKRIIETREWTYNELLKLDFNVLPSSTNFMFAESRKVKAEDIFHKLRENKILVRYFNKPRIDNFLRISIGTREEMEKFIEVLTAIVLK